MDEDFFETLFTDLKQHDIRLCFTVLMPQGLLKNTYKGVVFVLLFFLAMPHSMWALSSLTRDQTCTPCTGSIESQPLDSQGSPTKELFNSDPCIKADIQQRTF